MRGLYPVIGLLSANVLLCTCKPLREYLYENGRTVMYNQFIVVCVITFILDSMFRFVLPFLFTNWNPLFLPLQRLIFYKCMLCTDSKQYPLQNIRVSELD